MNLDAHWLKERYKGIPTYLLNELVVFGENDPEFVQLKAELERRERTPMKPMDEDKHAAYRQEANEEEYNNQKPIKHMIIPDLEEVEEEEC